MSKETLLKLTGIFLRLICRFEIQGEENIPRTGAVLYVSNHLGIIDPLVGYVGVNRSDVTGWIADKHKKNPLYAAFINSVGGIWLNRENVDMRALRKALQALKEGRIFGLAPEGTRSPTGAMIKAKEGASYLALVSGVQILPAAITGTEKAASAWGKLSRPKVTIRFGKVFQLPPMDRTNREESMARATDEIMCRIAVILPPEYRGVYANHPRLKELLDGAA